MANRLVFRGRLDLLQGVFHTMPEGRQTMARENTVRGLTHEFFGRSASEGGYVSFTIHKTDLV
jgi:hypothetical protein